MPLSLIKQKAPLAYISRGPIPHFAKIKAPIIDRFRIMGENAPAKKDLCVLRAPTMMAAIQINKT